MAAATVLLVPGASRGGGSASPRSGQFAGIVPHLGGPHNASSAYNDECPCGSGDLTYHGGPIMPSATLYAIYWLPPGYSYSGGDSGYEGTLDQYLADVAHDSHTRSNAFALGTQYFDTLNGGHQVPYDVTFSDANTVVVTDALPSNGCSVAAVCLTDAQLRTEIASVVQAQGWPQTLTSEYLLFTPPGLESCFNATNSDCSTTTYCAYHSYFTSAGGQIIYANMPDTVSIGCDIGEHPNESDADPTISVLSHELNESFTDPHITAWYDSLQFENGDKCAWTFGTLSGADTAQYNQTINGHHYLMQEEWSNANSTCYQASPAPAVSSFSPSTGGPGTTVTINGHFLTDPTGVTVGGHAMSSVTVVSDAKITAVVPSDGTTGTIAVTSSAGTGTSSGSFAFAATPRLTAFSPAAAAAGTTVTITGTGFTGVSGVSFNGQGAAGYTVVSATKITAVVAPGTTSGPITVTTNHGDVTSIKSFGIPPHVTSFGPMVGPTGTSITIQGSGFVGTTAVKVGGQAATSVVIDSDTQLEATVAARTTSGKVSVATPGGTVTSTDAFAVIAVSSFSPAKGISGTTVTLSGTNFGSATGVLFGGALASGFHEVSATRITAVVPGGTTSGTVTVLTPAGNATSTKPFGIVPAMTSFSPLTAPAGASVAISGSGFTGATAVMIGSRPASHFTVDTDGHITATVGTTTSGKVTVTTPYGKATGTDSFTMVAVNGITPAKALIGASVVVTGTGLSGATAVRINGTTETILGQSATRITVRVVAGTTSGTVAVDTPNGTATSTRTFSLLPKVDSFTPTTGPTTTSVTIHGSGFTGATAVKFGGKVATTFHVDSDTQITAVVASGTRTGAVTVTTPLGAATSGSPFTVTV